MNTFHGHAPDRFFPESLCAMLCILAVMTVAGCAAGDALRDDTRLQIEGLAFENRSASPVTSIRLRVPATGNFVSCGRIAPGARCTVAFPEVDYAGYPVVVSWTQGGAAWSGGEVTPQVAAAAREKGVGTVRVVVTGPGSAGVLVLPGEGSGGVNLP